MYSLNFEEFFNTTNKSGWDISTKKLITISKNLQKSGSACIILCANTLHIAAEEIQRHISIPLIHIAEETAKAIYSNNIKIVGLLGTRYTMQADFYRNILSNYGIKCLIPDECQIDLIHDKIYKELAIGEFINETKQFFKATINTFRKKGAEGIILGCTEIPLIIRQKDTSIRLFDTLQIHCEAAVNYALEDITIRFE